MRLILISILFGVNTIAAISLDIDYTKFKGNNIDVQLKARLVNPGFTDYSDQLRDLLFLPIHIHSFSLQSNSCEETILNIYRANSENELRMFNGYSKNKFFYDKSDTSKFLLGLVHKLTFQYGNDELAIVKYFELKDSLNVGFNTFQLRKISSGWQLCNFPSLENIEYAIRVLKTNTFWEFYNQSKSKISAVNDLRNKVKDDRGIVDIDKLGKVIKENKEKLKQYCDL